MARGGKREGAGRRPGSRTKKTEERLAAIESSGLTPLDYMLSVLRNEEATASARMDAAKNAAPYIHAKLATTEFKGAGLDRITDALVGLIDRAQTAGGGVGGLLRR